ncbi:hypothetical protein KX75_20020 [Salmonella enterica subsp. enterica]|nr:hypothetical protein [Salmonella enterica subsp. enterica serovar Mikawasima]EDN7229162.1 hypothetical protein [Salmonella enterica subsp. enterica serovar Mikawasima]
MSIQRREVYLVIKHLPDDRVLYVEGMKYASNYFFDGHSRVDTTSGDSASFVEFSPTGVSLDIENYCTLSSFFDLSTLAGLSRRNLPEAGIRLLFQI